MRKIFINFFYFFLVTLIITVIILSTIGIKTNKFNKFITQKIYYSYNNINLELKKIKFKFDLKELSLFLETTNPKLNFKEVALPVEYIKVYVDFLSVLESEPKIKKINLSLSQIEIEKLKQISFNFKPSNLNSILNNKIYGGRLNINLELFLNENNFLEDFIAKGEVLDLKANITKNINLKNSRFNFFADKSDILIKMFFGEIGPIKILEGDLRVKISSEILIESNFKTDLKLDKKTINSIKFTNSTLYENLSFVKAELNNNLFASFDKTYKLKNYNFKINGEILKAIIDFKESLKSDIISEELNELVLQNSKINSNFSPKQITNKLSGKYSFNGDDFLQFNFENNNLKNKKNFKISANYNKAIDFNIINYQKPKGSLAKLNIDFDKNNEQIKFNEIKLTHDNNLISIKNLEIKKNKIETFDNISIKTFNEGKENNNLDIFYREKIIIKGTKFDAKKLSMLFSKKGNQNILSSISKDIEIDITNVIAPLSEKINNFKLIGKIEKGKFIKISAKGDFGKNNFLDITMKNDKKNGKKYLEIYSDKTKPLLTEFDFFEGLTGGKLLYTSIIDKNSSNSKLKIENFKVINAPGMVKLLSLADLGGLVDLAKGEGISFEILEINMKKNPNTLTINEVLALGPSVSVLMEGYQNKSETSLRGTLIPARTLNKMISQIPIIGKVVIPKEVGEGLFGISFKIKGPKGSMKTSINPVRTITPRFIQKIIEKNKNIK